LIDAGKDRHLWGQTYDRDLADVFAIQSEIAKAIADQLQAKLSPNEKAAIERPPTSDLAAFDLYTRAKPIPHSHAFGAGTKDRLLQAADLLNQAIARDPNFVSAYCVLGYVHDQLYFLNFDHTPARIALAQSAVETALRLQPGAGEAHLARADYLYRCFLDYEGARIEIAIARRTLSNDPTVFELLAYIDRRQGRWEDSAQNFEHSIALDPRNYFILQQAALSYQSLRQYRKMAAALDRALEIVPNDSDTRLGRASIDLDWRGDTKPMHSTIEEIGSQNPSDLSEIADQWVTLALCERDFAAADRALTSLGDNVFGEDAVSFRGAFAEGLLARMKGDDAAANAGFSRARVEQEEKVHAHPDYGPNLCALALIDAGLGRKEDALREGQRAIELLPVEKDFINGVHMIEFYAITCAWVGEKDLALKYLASAVQLPGTLSYGQLKLMPWWDPLRGDPRFEKIVASLAPKEPSK
jgi:tetratricopeptide (TPR) repeat protein